MKLASIISALFVFFALALPAFAQERAAAEETKAVSMSVDDGAVSTAIDGVNYTCYADDDDATLRAVTSCYCGGEIGYLGVHCAGFPSVAVCCATKCNELQGILDSQR